jgi:hypothetical protein
MTSDASRNPHRLIPYLIGSVALVTTATWLYMTKLAAPLTIEYISSLDDVLGTEYQDKCSTRASELFSRFKQTQLKFQNSLGKKLTGHNQSNDMEPLRAIVWECTENGVGCGGLGSRVDGIITAFSAAIVTDRAFLIHSHKPGCLADLYQFADPQLDWNATDSTMQILSQNFSRVSWIDHLAIQQWKQNALHELLPTSVVFVTYNMPFFYGVFQNFEVQTLVQEEGWNQFSPEDLYGCLWKYLLHPSPTLQNALDAFFDEWQDYYIIGIQIRTGGDGEWQDPSRVPHSAADQFFQCAAQVETEVDRPTKWFITTDSQRVRSAAMQRWADKILSTNATIMHVDRPDAKHWDNDGFFYTILEHAILTRSNHLIISRSTFGETASLAGHSSSHIYPFHGPCTLQSATRKTWQYSPNKRAIV